MLKPVVMSEHTVRDRQQDREACDPHSHLGHHGALGMLSNRVKAQVRCDTEDKRQGDMRLSGRLGECDVVLIKRTCAMASWHQVDTMLDGARHHVLAMFR